MSLSNRMQKLKHRLEVVEMETPGKWYFINDTILCDDSIISEPLVVRKALAYQYIAKNLPAYIKDDELIVGNPNQNSVGTGAILPKYATDEELRIAAEYRMDQTSLMGHHPADWNKLLQNGLTGVKQEIRNAICQKSLSADTDPETFNLYRAMIISLDAVEVFAKRHAEVALKMAITEKDALRKKELLQIAEVCDCVSRRKPETFWEALQLYWFTYCILSSGGEFIPLANLDRYLHPFYALDFENKILEQGMAKDLMASFLVKCNERIIRNTKLTENHKTRGNFSSGVPKEIVAQEKIAHIDRFISTWKENEDINSDDNYNFGQDANVWLMNVILGGRNADGTDATNDVSYMILEIMHEMGLLMPTLSVRMHRGSSEKLYRQIALMLRHGRGEPAIYYDESIIPGFLENGVSLEEACNYSNDGCWETLIPGKSHFTLTELHSLQCLEWTLMRGESLREVKNGIDTGDPCKFSDFESLYQAFLKQIKHDALSRLKFKLDTLNLAYMIAPDPLLSSLMDDCILRGKDITQNGNRYILHMYTLTGLANTVDSLAVIKSLVYEKKQISLEVLIDAIRNDWKGYEALRALAINQVPKFGNDDDYVDQIAVRFLKDFEIIMKDLEASQNLIHLPISIGTFQNYSVYGRFTGASADGRESGGALASNYSPSFGRDINGPTAVMRSATKADLLHYYCGSPVDLSIQSSYFEGEIGLQRLIGLIKGFGELGGQILTITSTSVEELREAQKNPERYSNLIVRLGGLSAYFVSISPAQQENIIRRFEKGSYRT